MLESRAMLAVIATDDSYDVLHDHMLSGSSVLMNDYDPEFSNLTASLVSGPSNGTLNFSSNGSFTYTPDANFAGSDSFSYEVTSGSGTDQASVTINVINHAPVANDGSESVLHDETLSSSVTAYDMDGDNLIYSLVAGPAYGTLTFSANGSFTYQAPNGFGTDSFTFSVTDGIDTDTGTCTINVINHAPVANDSSESVLHGHALASTVSAYDMDGDALTYSLDSGPAHGFINFTSGGSFAYLPHTGYVGSDSFSFSVTDGLETDTGTITINVTNNAPVASDDWGLTYVDETLISSVTAYDMDGDMLIYSVASGPAHGAVIMHQGGGFSYTPATGFDGQDSFSFSASDGMASDTGTFTVQVDVWSGGGGGGKPVVSLSGSGTIEEEGETTSTFTVTRTGDTANPLTVGLVHVSSPLNQSDVGSTGASADDYTLSVNGASSGYSVNIPAGQDSVTVTVKAVDDTKVEENEGFQIWLTASTAYIPHSSAHRTGDFTIKDDEWRWVEPDGPEPDNAVYQWNDSTPVVRTALLDGTLVGRGRVAVTQEFNSVSVDLEGTLTFPGIVGQWTYNARQRAAFAFTGDSQTGQIWYSGSGSNPPAGSAGSGGYLSMVIGYNWAIADNTGTDIHTVTVTDTLNVAAGGTYGLTPTVSADGKHGGGSLAYNFTESWHEEILGGKPVTLLFRKGPAE